ncbi:hypothetical protein FOZ61_001216 [Perkinsus olseni]|uniref:Uncharacterized protein n=1 Tax=Perkinsus olseni TaxID=32597 RepID=A0A7J6LXM1_PEROL|nr:hypothetical protein FOL46_004906 [Perkinsus olseni]KAF4663974.1 hypothetical protein FOZ61_001216 [Perkinsus olseni]
MNFLSAFLVSFLLALVDAQTVGRYELVYDKERFILDVTEGQMVFMTVYCNCGKGFYTDGPYRLLKGSGLYEYIIDFSGVCEDGAHWTITFDSPDTLTTTVGNKTATFSRSTHLLVSNQYYYYDRTMNRKFYFAVRSDGMLAMKVTCSPSIFRKTIHGEFRLVRNDRRFSYITYDLVPAGRGSVEAFQARLACACELTTSPQDFTYLAIATEGTMFTEFRGARIYLEAEKDI